MTNKEAIKNLTTYAYYMFDTLPEDVKKAFDIAIKALEQSEEKPRGEWILKEKDYDVDGNNLYECTNCHHSDTHSSSVEVPFCWYCGADMRKGGAE